MSTFKVKSSVLSRLSGLCSFFEPTTDEKTKKLINTVRLENKNGHSYAVATNQHIAAIEYLGVTDQPNESTHLILSDEFKQQMFMESLNDTEIKITTIPEIAIASLESSSGYTLSNCCHWFDKTYLDDWREWATITSDKASGIMFLDMFRVESLIKASPSGKLVFPEIIDVDVPIVLKDYNSPNWVGVFFAKPPGEVTITEGAELPEWWDV